MLPLASSGVRFVCLLTQCQEQDTVSTVLKAGRTRKFAFKHELAAGPASKIKADKQHTERVHYFLHQMSLVLYVGKVVFSLKTEFFM